MMSESQICAPHTEFKSESDLATICRERRERCAPAECTLGSVCWVMQGIDAYHRGTTKQGSCGGCRGRIYGGFEWGSERQR
jgi:hypothetical protein